MNNAEPGTLVIVLVVVLAALGSSGCVDGPEFDITGDQNSVTIDNNTELFSFTIYAIDELPELDLQGTPYDRWGEYLTWTHPFGVKGDMAEGDERTFSTEVEVVDKDGELVEQIDFSFKVNTRHAGGMGAHLSYFRNTETNGSRYILET